MAYSLSFCSLLTPSFEKQTFFILMKSNLSIHSSPYHVLGLYLRNLTNPRLQNFLMFPWELYSCRFTFRSIINLSTFYTQSEFYVEINFCIQMLNSFSSIFWKEYFSPLIIFGLCQKSMTIDICDCISALSFLLHQSFCLCWNEEQTLWIIISL